MDRVYTDNERMTIGRNGVSTASKLTQVHSKRSKTTIICADGNQLLNAEKHIQCRLVNISTISY